MDAQKLWDAAVDLNGLDSVGWDKKPMLTIETPEALQELFGVLFKAAWQPIETAPKNGRDILIFTKQTIRLGFWDSARDGVWSIWPGRELAHPSHWMPLPEVP